MIAGSSQNLATPAAVTLTARTAGSNETAIPPSGTVHVSVTALNYFGETVKSADASVAWASGQVVDVTITPVPGAQQYNVYAATSSSVKLQAGTTVQSGT